MDGPVAVAGVNGNGLATSAPSTIDPELIVGHLTKILAANLGATESDLTAPGSLLSSDRRTKTVQTCLRLAHDAQAAPVCIQKELVESVVEEETPNGVQGKAEQPMVVQRLAG